MSYDHTKQGRDDRLANQIISTLATIRLRSQGSYDELVNQLTAARYSTTNAKIRKMAYSQLQSMMSLITGFESKANADLGSVLNASIRPKLSIAVVHQPFTIKRADGVAQPCFLAAADPLAYTFLPANKSGTPSSSVALGNFTHTLDALKDEMPMISKRNDNEILVRNHDLVTSGGDDTKIRRVSLTAAGAIQTSFLQDAAGADVTLTAGAAGFADRPAIEDFCDGTNLWAMEYNDTTGSLRIHKVALATGVETILVITNIHLGVVTAIAEGAFFAVGDHAVLMGFQKTGVKSKVLFFTLPDGNATTTIDFNASAIANTDVSTGGTVIRYYTRVLIDTTYLRGFHFSTLMTTTRKIRAFLTPNAAGTSVNPINVVDIDPIVVQSATPHADDTIPNVVTEKILGQTDGTAVWPIARTSDIISNTNMQRVAVSADGERLISVNGAATPWDTLLFSVTGKRQISAMVPVSPRVTSLDRLSKINVAGSPMLAVATILSDIALVELSV